MALSILCDVYRSARIEGMYLYVAKSDGLSKVPDALMKRFGRAELAMGLKLDASRKLAQADVHHVMKAIGEQGFYLQMPPKEGMQP